MTEGQWRRTARKAIDAARAEGVKLGLSGPDLERHTREHGYPFGLRECHPYKVWLKVMREVFPQPSKLPEPIVVDWFPALKEGQP